MRWVSVAVALVGCGRIAFDVRSDEGVDAIECIVPYAAIGPNCFMTSGFGSWTFCEGICESMSGHLAALDDDAERDRAVDAFTFANYWIGTSDRVTEGVYLTTVGAPAFLDWAPGDPTGDAEDCLVCEETGPGMRDTLCTANNDCLCEYDGRSVDPTAF